MIQTALAPRPAVAAPARMQRVQGRAEVSLTQRDGATRLDRLHQSGSAKAMLPRGPGAPEVVFLNTAGGLTGGDALTYAMTLGPGARATATTQTAERIYASSGERARVSARFSVGPGGALDWLPQETILFERSALTRDTDIELTGDGRALICETLVLGRAAMGETLSHPRLLDRRTVRRDGRPVLIDPVRIGPDTMAAGQGPAVLGQGRAFGLLALVADGAEDAVNPLRGVLAAAEGVEAGVSGWNGRCLVRLRAPDAWPLRRAMASMIRHLRGGALPRVWQI